MIREQRSPPEIISKIQSHDVYEQLRSRNLKEKGEDYLPVISEAFSRKVVARTMPTFYDESGLLFISHRRLDGEDITAELCDNILVQAKK